MVGITAARKEQQWKRPSWEKPTEKNTDGKEPAGKVPLTVDCVLKPNFFSIYCMS